MQRGDFFDQVDFARDVGPPAGDLHREAVVFRRGNEAYRREQPFDFLATDLDAEHVADARWAQEDGARLLRLGPQIEWRLAHFAARDGANQVDGARERIGHAEHVDAALEAIARFAREPEGAARAPDARRLEVGSLEHDVRRALGDLGFGASHDARHDRGAFGVADDGHLS